MAKADDPPARTTTAQRAHERPTTFSLLIPDAASAEHTDWTLELALPLLERAARGPVEGLAGEGTKPFEAIRRAVEQGSFDEIVISTLPRRVSQWLRRDLPRLVQELGLPVEVVTPGRDDKQPVGGVAGNISIP